MNIAHDVYSFGFLRQFKLIQDMQKKWLNLIYDSDGLFTTLSHNLMREQRSLECGFRSANSWCIKEVPEYPPSVVALLRGDVQSAGDLAAAYRIENCFEQLLQILDAIQECISTISQIVDRAIYLRDHPKAMLASPCLTSSPIHKSNPEEKIQLLDIILWPAIVGELKALISRLYSDCEFRRGLLRCINSCVADSPIEGDFNAPLRICYLWRQAAEVVNWSNVLNMIDHLLIHQ